MTRDEINCYLEENWGDASFLLCDGFEDAFLGVVGGMLKEPVTCYDREKCISILMNNGEMQEEAAEEYFQFNVEGSYVGPHTPMFLFRID